MLEVCAYCVLAMTQAKRECSFTPVTKGQYVEILLGSNDGDEYKLATGETTDFSSVDGPDFASLVDGIRQIAGQWRINGMRVYPASPLMFRGTGTCTTHLILVAGKDALEVA